MKKVTKVLIIVEILDIITTFIGIYLYPYMVEMNPAIREGWALTILLKSGMILLAVVILERRKQWSKYVWIVPSIAVLPVFTNIANIVAETLVR